jgi:hypothetical protein
MSIVAFKNKSVINYGSNRSGKPPGGFWLPQGPFGASTTALKQAIQTFGPKGFSINGGHRNVGGVGRDMKMSKSGTPYRGTEPIGFGGTYGKYPSATLVGNTDTSSTGAVPNAGSKQPAVQPVLNSRIVDTMGTQYLYIKPSVLSNYGMLRKKYRWAYNGQYPNAWVQPVYTGNQTDSASANVYTQNKSAANMCNVDINKSYKFIGNVKKCGPTLCSTSTARFKYNNMASNAPYTKFTNQPLTSSEYTLYIQRGCANPTGATKPFPYAVQTGSGQSAAGTSITSFGNACNTSNIYLTPPEWYIKSSSGMS